MRASCLAVAWASLCVALPVRAENPDETKPWVPELSAFHEIIYPLWHNAWPSRDTTLIRELWPNVQQQVAAVEKAELPGILRDKKDAWQAGIVRLKAAEKAYGTALESGELKAKLDAVEELHSSFEGLVRTVRPVMLELHEFHKVLYVIYHHIVPKEDTALLAQQVPELLNLMEKLNAAPAPAEEEEAKEAFDDARDRLAAAVDTVASVTSSKDWNVVAMAIEEMHSAYRELEKLAQ